MRISNVSSEFVRSEKSAVQNLGTAEGWIDAILIAMVVASVVGLAYAFLVH